MLFNAWFLDGTIGNKLFSIAFILLSGIVLALPLFLKKTDIIDSKSKFKIFIIQSIFYMIICAFTYQIIIDYGWGFLFFIFLITALLIESIILYLIIRKPVILSDYIHLKLKTIIIGILLASFVLLAYFY